MSIEDDLLIYDYLDRVSDYLIGKLAPEDRSELIDQLRRWIEARRQAPSRRGVSNVGQILGQLGEPEECAERLLQGSADLELGGPAVRVPASGESPVVRAVPGSAPDTGHPTSLRARARMAAERMLPSTSRVTSRSEDAATDPLVVVRTYVLEVGALLLYTLGTIIVSYLGFLLGAALTVFSKVWNDREKGFAIVAIPALVLGGGMFVVWLDEGRDRAGTTAERFERVTGALGDLFYAWPLVSGFLTAIYLLYRLLVAQRPTR